MDFTISTYTKLLYALLKAGYDFQTFSEFLEKPGKKVILLRHDVDAKKLNSLHFAEIQHGLGIKGTYYFRMVPQSFDEEIIQKIAGLGHEIGYHYEDMDFARLKLKGRFTNITEEDLYKEAISIFEKNLTKLRMLYPIETICMHGSPMSLIDNKSIWKKYNYRDYGLIGEPYFDINFNEVLYLTDTGRRWNGNKFSIRDKVETGFNLSFRTTSDIIQNIKILPPQVMLTFHPQRWNDKPLPWLKELILQNIKNQAKKFINLKQNAK